MDKIKLILSSIRFWQVVVGAVVYALGQEGVIALAVAQTITTILGVSVTIGTVDKVAGNIGGRQEGVIAL